MSFANNMGKDLSSKYSQEILDHGKEFGTDVFKTASKRAIQKTTEETGDLIGNKIADVVARSYKSKITASKLPSN